MNLVLDINQVTYNNIFFYESVKNTIMNDSEFIRIIYSNNDIILNGIYIQIDINNDENSNIVNIIDQLEQFILKQYNPNKLQNNKLKDQLIYNINKINKDNECICLLKISGIWETPYMIGLTYKFIFYE
mgnify:CR=1 FL=1